MGRIAFHLLLALIACASLSGALTNQKKIQK